MLYLTDQSLQQPGASSTTLHSKFFNEEERNDGAHEMMDPSLVVPIATTNAGTMHLL